MPASVDTLLFLHADTRLPSGFKDTIACALRRPEVVGGAFDFSFGDHPQMSGMRRWMLQAITHVNRFRFRWGRSFYGDQAIFVSRRIFEHIGGYPKVRLMEDIAFSRRMHRIGRTAILQPPVQTSPRRFIERGIAWQFCCDLLLLVLDSLGIRPAPLSRHYNSLNAVGHRNPTFEAAGEFRH